MKLLLYLIFLFSQAVPISADSAPLDAGWRVASLLNPGADVCAHQMAAEPSPLEIVESVEEETSSSHGTLSESALGESFVCLSLWVQPLINHWHLQRLGQSLFRVFENYRL